MRGLLPAIFTVACLLLLVALAPKPDWENMACATDFISKARVNTRNIKRYALGQQALQCHKPGRLGGFLGLIRDDERR